MLIAVPAETDPGKGRVAATHDQIELVAPGACVGLEQAVATQAVMEESPALSPVHAANGAAITSARTSSGAGSSRLP